MEAKVGRSQNRVRGFVSPELDYQLLRALGVAAYGGSSVGECMYATNGLAQDEPAAWVARFSAMGRQAEAFGDAAVAARHTVSARDHYFRAATYYRAAEYYADPVAQSRGIGLRSREAFTKGAAHASWCVIEPVRIACEGGSMPGYFIKPDGGSTKRKTVILISGSDGTSEEVFFSSGAGAVQRGYNALIIDGPGQMGMYRDHPEVHFRPDYEVPLGLALDYAVGRPEVDSSRLALFGLSMGGYFVSRAAAFDNRVKALIPDSPLTDVSPLLAALLGDVAAKVGHDVRVEDIDRLPDDVVPAFSKPPLKSHALRFGARSASSFIETAGKYVLDEAILKRIACPCLVLGSAGEGALFAEQADRFAATVSGAVTRHEFSAREGADAHCQLGNPAASCAVAYDWLDERLA